MVMMHTSTAAGVEVHPAARMSCGGIVGGVMVDDAHLDGDRVEVDPPRALEQRA